MRILRRLPLLVFISTAAVAQAGQPAPQAATIQVVRPGVHDLSCQALASEINALAAAAAPAPTVQAEAKERKAGANFLRVLGSAAPFVPRLGGAGSLITAAAGSMEQASSQAAMSDVAERGRAMAERALAGPTPADQRKERLTTIFEAKHC